ncbi:MAG: hypothetical protein ACOX7J_06745 [Bacillota bacterium]|jgi:hypothetical protein
MQNDKLYQGTTKNIMQLENQFEADLLLDILLENGIPAIIEEYDDKVFGETFNEFKGWGNVWAEEKYEADIKKFVKEIRSQSSSDDFDEEIDEDSLRAMDSQKEK